MHKRQHLAVSNQQMRYARRQRSRATRLWADANGEACFAQPAALLWTAVGLVCPPRLPRSRRSAASWMGRATRTLVASSRNGAQDRQLYTATTFAHLELIS